MESKPFEKSSNFLKSRPRTEPRLGGLPNTPCDPATAAQWFCGRSRLKKEPNQILGQCNTQCRSGALVFVGFFVQRKRRGGGGVRGSERLLHRTLPPANPLTVCSSWRRGGRKNELWNFITPGPPLMQLTSYSEPSYLDKQHNEKDWLFLGKTAQATTMNTRWRWITSIMGSCVLDTLFPLAAVMGGQTLFRVNNQSRFNIWKSNQSRIKREKKYFSWFYFILKTPCSSCSHVVSVEKYSVYCGQTMHCLTWLLLLLQAKMDD